MGYCKEDSAKHKGRVVIEHQKHISDQRKQQSSLDQTGHEMISGRVFVMNVEYHEDHG